MVRRIHETKPDFEEFLAELTDAAYRAALRHGQHGSFLDLELALWRDLRRVLQSQWEAAPEHRQDAENWSSWREPAEREEHDLLVRRSR